MPVCVDCERWSPGTFRTCPDCAGVLKLEPLWARPSKDAQLARLDWEAKWWHRRARDESQRESVRTEAWAMVEDRRHRYEDLRRRLLPVLEVAESRRVQRMKAGARAAGLAVRTCQAKAAREELERDTTEEAAARAEGMTVSAYRRRAVQEAGERERLWGDEVPDPGWFQGWIIGSLLTIPITAVVGLVLGLVFLLAGSSVPAAVAGTVFGGFAGWLLCSVVFLAARSALGRPGAHSSVIAAVGEPVSVLSLIGILVVPPVLAVLVAFWLA